MKIQDLWLENYRCFPAMERPLDFHPQITVIAATNGRGKSAILDAVTVALSPFTSGFTHGDVKNFKKSDATLERIEVPVPGLKPGQGIAAPEPRFPVGLKATIDLEVGQLVSIRRSLDSANGKTKSKEAAGLKKFAASLARALKDPGNQDLPTLPVISYYGTGRLHAQKRLMQRLQGTEVSNAGSRTMGYLNSLSAESTYKHFADWMKSTTEARIQESDSDYSHSAAEAYKGMLEAVSAAVQVVLDGQQWSDLRHTVKQKELTVFDGSKRLPLALLSDGLRSIIAMIGDLAYRCVVLNPHLGPEAPLRTSGVVLIDEIEMHLHPSWQQQVLGQLQRAFPAVQFICTTHSPQVLSTVKPESIRTIDLAGRVSSPHCKTYGAESKRVLEELMQVESRPPVLKDQLREFIRITEKGDWDSARYHELHEILMEHLGASDPVIMEAEIRRNFQQLEEVE